MEKVILRILGIDETVEKKLFIKHTIKI